MKYSKHDLYRLRIEKKKKKSGVEVQLAADIKFNLNIRCAISA